MALIERVSRDGITPDISRPGQVLAGDPVHTSWNLEERGSLYCGMWQSTPGKWAVSYSEWEYVYIHEGHSVLTGEDGSVTQLKAGDSFVIRPGFRGTWEVLETTLKDYVILN